MEKKLDHWNEVIRWRKRGIRIIRWIRVWWSKSEAVLDKIAGIYRGMEGKADLAQAKWGNGSSIKREILGINKYFVHRR